MNKHNNNRNQTEKVQKLLKNHKLPSPNYNKHYFFFLINLTDSTGGCVRTLLYSINKQLTKIKNN